MNENKPKNDEIAHNNDEINNSANYEWISFLPLPQWMILIGALIWFAIDYILNKKSINKNNEPAKEEKVEV